MPSVAPCSSPTSSWSCDSRPSSSCPSHWSFPPYTVTLAITSYLQQRRLLRGTLVFLDERARATQTCPEVSARAFADVIDLSAQAGASLDEITSAARESGRLIGQVVVALSESAGAARHVAALIGRLGEGVDEIRDACEQMRELAAEMRERAARSGEATVRSLLERFRALRDDVEQRFRL